MPHTKIVEHDQLEEDVWRTHVLDVTYSKKLFSILCTCCGLKRITYENFRLGFLYTSRNETLKNAVPVCEHCEHHTRDIGVVKFMRKCQYPTIPAHKTIRMKKLKREVENEEKIEHLKNKNSKLKAQLLQLQKINDELKLSTLDCSEAREPCD